jgi:hypothetical protein
MEAGLVFLPKEKTLVGIDYNECECMHNDKMMRYHQVGIGIGVLVLYLIFFKKGGI